MGVSGLWDIISPAERKYSLEELALDRTVCHSKSLRIAIDISIWNFQAQATQGGVNTVLRTIFYRCCRLYTLGIRPVFVFDGDQRPAYKRNRNIDTTTSNKDEHHLLLAMLKLFGFAVWNAAGEAEAECAVLQRLGYVDIIFTTDVDVFLFGGQRVARDWPGTDYELMSCIDTEWIEQTTSLDRSDMILIALLSGSDYASGVKKLGINVSLALAKLKYHRPVLDILQNSMDTNICSNTDNNDDRYTTRLYEMMDKLQHELNTNQSGFLRRRLHKVDLNVFLENEQLTQLAKDWIHPKAAILDPTNTEAAKAMHALLNDENVTPEFVSLASFCQVQFDWSKSKTMGKFANKLFPGYMLHRTATWLDKNSVISSGTPTTKKLLQQGTRRQRTHPYFNEHYRDKNLFYSQENRRQEQQPMDLSRIHIVENVRKTKHSTRLQKLSRCRVEWRRQPLVEFLSMVETELLDEIGMDDGNSQAMNNHDSQVDDHIYDSQHSNYSILGSMNGSDDDDNCIDLTVTHIPPAPALGPPTLAMPQIKQSIPQSQSSPTPTNSLAAASKRNEDGWIYQYCDPNKCCRQWIGSNLVQKVYPKMMNEFTKSQQSKRTKRTRTTSDNSQQRLDSFFTPIHGNSSNLSDDIQPEMINADTNSNIHHTLTTTTATTSTKITTKSSDPHQQRPHSGQSLILPRRRSTMFS
ncbi:hypothetical protein BCR42DRAFT_340385 [Absidia repens]|uniref:PIN domain-like protein n=1 Tax=Absidia repens TaxID=90262 RepID=A0A1X2J0J5_9FUNG|nr:hypothetical protein BCR42DRAFT_340385 [Absidia repens]